MTEDNNVIENVVEEVIIRTVKVHIDENNVVKGFYPSWVKYGTVPEPNIEVTEEVWSSKPKTNQWKLVDNNGEYSIVEYIPELSLEEAKQKKLKELDKYYASDECWSFQVRNGSDSLTQTAEWFGRMIPASAGYQIMLFNDSGEIQNYTLTKAIAEILNHKIQVEKSLLVKQKKLILINDINNCTTKEEVDVIDVKVALGEIPRVIDLQSL